MINIKIKKLLALFLGIAAASAAQAGELAGSMKNEMFENPFIAIGVNSQTNTLSGYVSVTNPAPGKIDRCSFSFAGKTGQQTGIPVSVKNAAKIDGSDSRGSSATSTASVDFSVGKIMLTIAESALPGDCDWILPFIGGAHIVKNGKNYTLSVNAGIKGDWTGVGVIASKRAYFHDNADTASVKKSFLVAGDVMYVYQEKPDWLYVKFEGSKKETAGWIKKSDMLRF